MKFTKEIMMSHIDDFKKLYDTRPIQNNAGGMGSAHMLPTYVYCKEMKPKLIIESGIWMGQGTWLLENASNAKIVSLDITLSRLQYRSPDVTYFENDIMDIDIDSILEGYDMDDVMVFLDDHQDFDKRLDFFLDKGIKHIIYEDNYPTDQGDCLSVKKIMSGVDYVIDAGGNRSSLTMDSQYRKEVLDSIDYYEEFSPIFDNTTNRWGGHWSNYDTPPSLMSESDDGKYDEFYDERMGYTWISYVRLKNKEELV
jgi:hypothetical protein